jgi:archaemetzincin
MGAICVVPVVGSESLKLDSVATQLETIMHRPVELVEALRGAETAYDPSRDQYSSRRLLELLHNLRPATVERVVGIAPFDLFVPVLTFVFGEAQLNGRAAIVSTLRLNNRFYGLPPDPGLLHERLVKEVVHELGHTYGLRHCSAPRCVMSRSTYVEEIDLKGDRYCVECARCLASNQRVNGG